MRSTYTLHKGAPMFFFPAEFGKCETVKKRCEIATTAKNCHLPSIFSYHFLLNLKIENQLEPTYFLKINFPYILFFFVKWLKNNLNLEQHLTTKKWRFSASYQRYLVGIEVFFCSYRIILLRLKVQWRTSEYRKVLNLTTLHCSPFSIYSIYIFV